MLVCDVFGLDRSNLTPVKTSELGQKAGRPLDGGLSVAQGPGGAAHAAARAGGGAAGDARGAGGGGPQALTASAIPWALDRGGAPTSVDSTPGHGIG